MTFTLLLGVICLSSCGIGDIGHSSIYESVSPAKLGSAMFFEDTGFQDTVMTMYVRDNAIGVKAIEIGSFNESQQPVDAVWSKDGTVVAVREEVRVSIGKNPNAEWGVLFTYVYDFRKHTAGHLTFSGKPSRQKAQQFSNTIKALLRSRGGEGQKVMPDWNRFDEVSRPVTSSDNLR